MKKPTKRQKISSTPLMGTLFAPTVDETESLQGLKRN